MVYRLYDRNYSGVNTSAGAVTRAQSEPLNIQDKVAIENEIILNQQLAEELHKPIIRKFEKCVHLL